MADILDEQKLSLIRRYPTELIVLGLISWCTYLQVQLTNINKAKELYFLQDRSEMLKTIQETNRLIDRNNTLYEKILIPNVQSDNIPYGSGNHSGKG